MIRSGYDSKGPDLDHNKDPGILCVKLKTKLKSSFLFITKIKFGKKLKTFVGIILKFKFVKNMRTYFLHSSLLFSVFSNMTGSGSAT